MNKHHVGLTLILVGFLALLVTAGGLLLSGGAAAAPAPQVGASQFVSLAALTFAPVEPNAGLYNRQQNLLSLNGPDHNFTPDSNIFLAPLSLPDRSRLIGLTVFGVDFDAEGAVLLRLKRCGHQQAYCSSVAETSSVNAYAAGQFEITPLFALNEVIDNQLYSYFLELEITALYNSGLRAVRLELATGEEAPTPSNVEAWTLAGGTTSFLLPNSGWAQVRVCAGDLSHLPNPTHYPTLIVDGRSRSLGPNSCVTVWGFNIELRRQLNTGASSGTYQFLR